jgi:hypothetical protein
MKRAIIIFIALLGASVPARADHWETTYHDLIRPRGRPRSDAIYQGALNYCYEQTGADRNGRDTPEFKMCMRGRGYRWQSAQLVRAPGSSGAVTYNSDSKDSNVGWRWEGGFRVCRADCENPEIPGSGFTCANVEVLGMPFRQCSK